MSSVTNYAGIIMRILLQSLVYICLLVTALETAAQSGPSSEERMCNLEKSRCLNAMTTTCSRSYVTSCMGFCKMGDMQCALRQTQCNLEGKNQFEQCERDNQRAKKDCELGHQQCLLQNQSSSTDYIPASGN
jgi:hypothetical protein